MSAIYIDKNIDCTKDNFICGKVTGYEHGVKTFRFKPFNGNIPINLSDCTGAAYVGTKSDGKIIGNACEIKDNKILLPLTLQMTTARGILKGHIEVCFATGTLKFFGINFEVFPSPETAEIESKDEFTLHESKIEEINKIIAEGIETSQGKSAYEIAVENGFEGTVEEWLESLKGKNGKDGIGVSNVAINSDGELEITFSDSSSINLGCIVGKDGKDGINGTDGKDGLNGKDGKDGADGKNYALTVSDKSEIASLVSNATIVQAPIFVDSVDKMTDTSRVYVLSSTGEIWSYMDTTIEQKITITDNITGTSDNPYQGGRFSSDGTVNNDVATHVVTPFIDLSKYNGKTIQIHLDGNRYISESTEIYIMYCVYNASKMSVSGRMYSTAGTIASINGCSTVINGNTSAILTLAVPATFGGSKAAMQYIRFCGLGTEAASNVYITYTDTQTVTGGQWVNTHTTYAPALTTADKNEIAEEVANMVDTELLGLIGTGTVTV